MIISPGVHTTKMYARVSVIRHVLPKSVDYTGFFIYFFFLSILTSLKTLFSFVEFFFFPAHAIITRQVHISIIHTCFPGRVQCVHRCNLRAHTCYIYVHFFFFFFLQAGRPRAPKTDSNDDSGTVVCTVFYYCFTRLIIWIKRQRLF